MIDPATASGLSTGSLLVLLGLAADIGGALLVSYAYFAIARTRDLPRAFASALFRGEFARGICAVDLPERQADAHLDTTGRTERNRLRALQGVSLLVLGFLCQAIGLVIR